MDAHASWGQPEPLSLAARLMQEQPQDASSTATPPTSLATGTSSASPSASPPDSPTCPASVSEGELVLSDGELLSDVEADVEAIQTRRRRQFAVQEGATATAAASSAVAQR